MKPSAELPPGSFDATRLALASFLARYREPTLTAYRLDLKVFASWCASNGVHPLTASRGQLELYLRHLEAVGYAPATVSRRFTTVAVFYRYAVIDGLIPANPAEAVTRPKVAWEGQKRTVLHPLEFAAVLTAARAAGPDEHALVALLGMLGLRVGEACAANISDLRYQAGYEILRVLGKGSKPADMPLPIPVLRAVREAVDGRTSGPILRSRRRPHQRADPAQPLRPADEPGRRHPGLASVHPGRRHRPTGQPARAAAHLSAPPG